MEGECMDVSQRPVDEPRVKEEESSSLLVEEEVFAVADESLESHPWPHLKNYYVFDSKDKLNDKSMYFQCVLCQPKKTIIKGQLKSLFNLKSHVSRKHPTHAEQFQMEIKSGSLRGKHRMSVDSSSLAPQPKVARQSSIAETPQPYPTGVRQSMVDRQIVDMFVHNMLPLQAVESPSFVGLIHMLNPSKTSMSRRTLGRRILARHLQLEEYLMRLLENIPWIATTADCWSAHNKSYLGMTAHWLDPETRARQHAVLACSRIKGHHSFDVLAQAMTDTHYKFNLQDKVTRTTTDNGKNFAKAFVQFGTDTELLPDICEPVVDADDEDIHDVDSEAVDDMEYISVDSILDEASGVDRNMLVHMKCAAHSFNLVVSVDANKALESSSFKSAYRKSMSKAQGLWNLQSCSTVAADILFDALKRRLVVPNSTRWNSMCDSVVALNKVLEKNRVTLHRVMTQLKLQTFIESDVSFLNEYAQVMTSVAKALDKIQGEGQAYLGSLLPTVAATVMRLKEAKSNGLVYCSPLVDALLAGITKRFGHLLEDQDCQLAAAFHPKFRLFWLEKFDNSQVGRVIKAMESVVQSALEEISDVGGNSPSNDEDEEDDLFSSITQPNESGSKRSLKSEAQSMVKTWLETTSKDVFTDAAFLGEPVLINLFTKYNTPIPSSAAVERLFSIGKDTLRAKKASLSDTYFEMLMFMRGNQHHMEEMSKEQKE